MIRGILLALIFTGCASDHSFHPVAGGNGPIAHVYAAKKDHPAWLDDLIAAINKKSEPELKEVLKAHFDSQIPLEDRVERMMGLAENGPFKITEDVSATASEVRVLIEDREGMKLALTLQLNPEGKASRMLISPANAGPTAPPKDYNNWSTLKDLMQQMRTDNQVPAMGIAVLSQNKLSVGVDGVREFNKPAEVGPNEPWSIGSIGKSLCSTLIGRAIDQGKLKFNSTLGQILSEAKGTSYDKVTLEQVMRHRSGLPQDMGMNRAQVDAIVGTAKTPTEIRKNYVKNLLARAPIGKPGERFAYSNGGYGILAVALERLYKKPYEEVMREQLFKPLGLKNSYIGSNSWPKNRPHGHVDGPNGTQEMEMGGPLEVIFAGAGGGVFMSVGDLAKFGQMHLDGLLGKNGYLQAATVQHLHSVPADQKGEPYACGWGKETMPNGFKFDGHNGSNGTFQAQLSVFPNQKMVIACIMNIGREDDTPLPLQAVFMASRKFGK